MEEPIHLKFDKAIEQLEKDLPKEVPAGCAEATIKLIKFSFFFL